MKKKKEKSFFQKEIERDIGTFQRLHGKKKLQFIYDYYKWYILAAVVIIIIIATFTNLIYQGQKDYRLRACVVLNTERYCTSWFHNFEKTLQKDGDKTPIEVNQDQPFDYDDMYYYVEEIEVQTTVSSKKMDVAICGPDMYSYLLAMNVCTPLDEVLPEDDLKNLKEKDMLIYDTANLRQHEDGSTDDSNAVKGYFSLDISNTEFGKEYNNKKDTKDPLYAVMISNTEHKADSIKLLQELYKD
ncbi:MAG: hypothetical protein Q4E73_09135 [Lachnospiraceae bacterium]|nr:hypothetical protein [Lachnospiraceae bacterium]